MTRRIKALTEGLAVGAMLFGIFALCQPFTMALYQRGFTILLCGLGLFIVITHVKR